MFNYEERSDRLLFSFPPPCALKAQVQGNAIDSHKDGNDQGGEEANGAHRLAHWVQGIEDCVNCPRNGHDSKAINSDYFDRIGENEQKAGDQVGEHVLQVIPMRTTDPLHILVVCDYIPSCRKIFWVDKDLQST